MFQRTGRVPNVSCQSFLRRGSLHWLLASMAIFLANCQSAPKVQSSGPPPAVPVSVAVATQESVPVEVHAVGTVEASAVIQVKSQVTGELTKVADRKSVV